MNYQEYFKGLIKACESEGEILHELTEREIETESEEVFRFCEQLRERLANRADCEEWKDALLDEIDNRCLDQARGHGTDGEA